MILDADAFSKFKDPENEDMKPVWNWIQNKNGKIAYSNTEKIEREWNQARMDEIRDELRKAGKIKLVPSHVTEQKENELIGKIASNDEHIIALALIANVKVLISGGDAKLIKDFKNRALVRGRVYLRKQHARDLLTKDTCP
ncbi:MAG: hypothetical protein OXU23_27665 [Candidatus Poribacteria bacterium]|nr:hypothetical protein [Candidatus Poribacteria bacterium]